MKRKIVDFRPLHDHILVKRLEVDTVSSGGILLPDQATKKSKEGEVIAVGEGKRTHEGLLPLAVKVGDYVMFDEWSGTEIKVSGEEFLLLKEESVQGVLTLAAMAEG